MRLLVLTVLVLTLLSLWRSEPSAAPAKSLATSTECESFTATVQGSYGSKATIILKPSNRQIEVINMAHRIPTLRVGNSYRLTICEVDGEFKIVDGTPLTD